MENTTDSPTSIGNHFHYNRLVIHTAACLEFVDLTDRILKIVHQSGMQNGLVNIQTKHTTTALLVNENEPLLLNDMKRILERAAPRTEDYHHNDLHLRRSNPDESPNGHSHCKGLFLRTSETFNLINHKLDLGAWQRIFLVELDQPKDRVVSIVILGVTSLEERIYERI